MAPSPTIRRLLKETAELSSPTSSPNPAFFAAPLSDSNLHEWHFTLLGPPSPSPYAGGLYHGRISLPPTYPLKPPNFRFLTPSGRFEVNREICLSISGFHEETWMPAWGVRTALTALRSFMAEKGTAGQVGGLEAPEHIRKQLAKDSRSWRCEGCAKTNEDVMREWWSVCREAGLAFEEEELGLDVLPEGMSVEARDPNAKGKAKANDNDKTKDSPSQTSTAQTPAPPTAPLPSPAHPSTPSPPHQPSRSSRAPIPAIVEPPQDTPSPSAPTTRSTSPHSLPMIPTPSAEAVQAAAEAILTPSDLERPPGARVPQRPISSIHAPPVAAASAAMQHAQPLVRREGGDLLTIDRAIAGVFLALVLMVLKKMFYPAGSGNAGMEFYLQRE